MSWVADNLEFRVRIAGAAMRTRMAVAIKARDARREIVGNVEAARFTLRLIGNLYELQQNTNKLEGYILGRIA